MDEEYKVMDPAIGYDYFGINLLNGNDLSSDNLAILKKIFRRKTIKKGGYFLVEGERSTQMAMVIKGLLRSYYTDINGNDITKYFYPEGSILFSYVAYLTQKESEYCIQALEDSEILAAEICDFEEAVEGNYQLLLFYKKMIDRALVMKEQHALGFKMQNSVERYTSFLAAYPGLEKRVKQSQIASFLGITPVSLSRIKRKLKLSNDNALAFDEDYTVSKI